MNADPITLVPSRNSSFRISLANMLAKEMAAWWHTRRWWIQCLLWLGLLNGTMALNIETGDSVTNAGTTFLVIAGLALPIAAISLGQDSILGERHSGTAAWVLSKPVQRPVFILAKLLTLGMGFLATGIVLPGVIAFFQITAKWPYLSAAGWAGAMGLVYLNLIFYLTLALMLAMLFQGRGPILAICLVLQLTGLMTWSYNLVDKYAPWLITILPWDLLTSTGQKIALVMYLVQDKPLPTVIPIIATALWCTVFMIFAIWRFRREEF